MTKQTIVSESVDTEETSTTVTFDDGTTRTFAGIRRITTTDVGKHQPEDCHTVLIRDLDTIDLWFVKAKSIDDLCRYYRLKHDRQVLISLCTQIVHGISKLEEETAHTA